MSFPVLYLLVVADAKGLGFREDKRKYSFSRNMSFYIKQNLASTCDCRSEGVDSSKDGGIVFLIMMFPLPWVRPEFFEVCFPPLDALDFRMGSAGPK